MVNYFPIHFPTAKHTATDISIFSLMLQMYLLANSHVAITVKTCTTYVAMKVTPLNK